MIHETQKYLKESTKSYTRDLDREVQECDRINYINSDEINIHANYFSRIQFISAHILRNTLYDAVTKFIIQENYMRISTSQINIVIYDKYNPPNQGSTCS